MTSKEISQWGYIFSAVQAVLESWREGRSVILTQRDQILVGKAIAFVEAARRACELINSPEELFSKQDDVISPPRALCIILDFWLSCDIYPETPEQLVQKLEGWQEVLRTVNVGRPLREHQIQLAESACSFFARIAEKADFESFELTVSCPIV